MNSWPQKQRKTIGVDSQSIQKHLIVMVLWWWHKPMAINHLKTRAWDGSLKILPSHCEEKNEQD